MTIYTQGEFEDTNMQAARTLSPLPEHGTRPVKSWTLYQWQSNITTVDTLEYWWDRPCKNHMSMTRKVHSHEREINK